VAQENGGENRLPFTLAHPAAVVLFRRTGLPLSALVAGALVPDFEYFIRLAPVNAYSHTLAGLLFFCIPCGIIALWLWHALLKQALVQLLPECHYRRLLPYCGVFQFRPAGRFAVIVFSVLLGAGTHLVWDSFTHYNGIVVHFFPALRATILSTQYGPVPIYKLFQHGSTLIGMVALLWFYQRWYIRAEAYPASANRALSAKARLGTSFAIMAIAAIVSLSCAWSRVAPAKGFSSFCTFAVTVCIIGISTLSIECMVFAVWWLTSDLRSAEEVGGH
jgi:hypothetical protein